MTQKYGEECNFSRFFSYKKYPLQPLENKDYNPFR